MNGVEHRRSGSNRDDNAEGYTQTVKDESEKETGFKNAVENDHHNRVSNRDKARRKRTTRESLTTALV